jgi:hypothetical protein
MKLSYLSGAKSLRAVGSSVTDDLGEYRFAGLEPGTYYIRSRRALPRPSIAEGTAEDRSAKPQQEEYVATYYPGSVSAQGAVPLEVEPAKAVQGIDIKLARSRPTRIGGRVVNQSSQPGPLTVFLYRADDPGDVLGETRANPQGQFAFRGVTRGSYTVVANTAFGRDTRYAELSVEAGADPIENLRLTLTDGFDIPGNVRVEDGGKLDLHTLRINMRPPWIISRVGRLPSESPTSDGNFKFGGVNPDRYIVTIDNLPDGWYLKSAWMGSRDVREGGVDLLRGATGPLQLVLTGRAGAVTGVVKDEKDARVAGATAALVPQEPARQRQPVFYRSVKTDRSGAFQLKGLPPGEYKLYAWESVENRAWVDAEFLKPVEAKAMAVTIREGDSQIVEIKVIPGRE